MTGIVMLAGSPTIESARKVEALAFQHGKSGVGHILWQETGSAHRENLRLWREHRAGDPGQPKGWDLLAPFGQTLAQTIVFLGAQFAGQSDMRQALVFESEDEARAFNTALLLSGGQAHSVRV